MLYSVLRFVLLCKGKDANAVMPPDAIASNPVKFKGKGDGTPLQYSCLENPMDGEAW